MQRREFLKISGVSLAGLIITGNSIAKPNKNKLLRLPNEVLAQSGNEWFLLQASNNNQWIHKDIVVRLKYLYNSLSVHVHSPSLPLNTVVARWNIQTSVETLTMGDHWERTYGDVRWQKAGLAQKMPWYFLQYDKDMTTGFGVKTGCNSICCWQLKDNSVQLTMDTRSAGQGVRLGNRILHAADIVAIQSHGNESAFDTGKRFCSLMCTSPRLPKQPVYGINDWYFAYGKNSYDLILEHTSLLADLATDSSNRPFSVIDAGWAHYSPLLPDDCCWQDDFSKPNSKFKDMTKLAGQVRELGMRPGLWTRPLCAAHDDKASLLLPAIPGRNNPKNPVLDPTIPENIERVKRNISTYNHWGYEMVKHDFSTYDILGKWGFEMKDDITSGGWSFYDNTKTTAEVILHLYQSIRAAAGDMYLIGCNTVSHLSAGLFELNRIGDDTSGNEWGRTRKMGVNTLAFRSIQHNQFYSADADCVGLTNKVPWHSNKQWMQLLAESGTPLFISAQPDALGDEQRRFIKKCFTTAVGKLPVGEPLDWMETLTPSKWKLDGQIREFDWS